MARSTTPTMQPTAAIDRIAVSAYRVPTDAPESDGTYEWDSTTLVLVRLEGGGETGLGYTYADRSAATLIQDKLVNNFHDHSRIEQMFFEGAPVPKQGILFPNLTRPGHGLFFKAADAKRYAI